jgi:hypothetical protein
VSFNVAVVVAVIAIVDGAMLILVVLIGSSE